MKNKEIWKDVIGYEGIYQVSNYGNVIRTGYKLSSKIKKLKPTKDSVGYYTVALSKNGQKKTKAIHILVAIAFLNHIPNKFDLVVNHKDFNKLNNNISNLEIVTQRENANQKHLPSSSKFVGVHLDKRTNKWISRIYIGKERKHLGVFEKEKDAHKAYQNALKKITNPQLSLF